MIDYDTRYDGPATITIIREGHPENGLKFDMDSALVRAIHDPYGLPDKLNVRAIGPRETLAFLSARNIFTMTLECGDGTVYWLSSGSLSGDHSVMTFTDVALAY